ncbi:hypothetical protein SKAU_G00333850 [Synaphobranchus kaupii]|uniref:Uncharacterized protein n=1 Tax=Synaphobranchus kaupii TaxID=118154 RepID=A0A9Q1ELR2_SYNKA|nr:hypothetical protein SKAU_G00333850 [Synaphobranchus kaupii]
MRSRRTGQEPGPRAVQYSLAVQAVELGKEERFATSPIFHVMYSSLMQRRGERHRATGTACVSLGPLLPRPKRLQLVCLIRMRLQNLPLKNPSLPHAPTTETFAVGPPFFGGRAVACRCHRWCGWRLTYISQLRPSVRPS